MHTLTIGVSVSTIADYAFSDCTSMHTLTIGASVSAINDYAFAKCYNLTNVTIKNPTPPLFFYSSFDYSFDSVPIDVATLTVPKGSKAAYESAWGWKSFGTIVEAP
jgi:hypothetical protein